MVCIVVIGASKGGFEPLRHIVAALPLPCRAAIFVVFHTGAHSSMLPSLLDRPGIPAAFAQDGDLIQASRLSISPPDNHMFLQDGYVRLNQAPKVNDSRPAIDPLFLSAADEDGPNVMGIVLSGGGGDGAFGLRAITERGGAGLVQRPAIEPSMPRTALAMDDPEALSVEQIAQRVRDFCS